MLKQLSIFVIISFLAVSCSNTVFYRQKAERFASNEQCEKAIEYYKRILETKPDDYDSMISIASCSMKLNKTDDGIKYYEMALLVTPEDTDTLMKLGNLYYDRKEYDKAITYFEKVPKINAYDYKARLRIADILIAKNDMNAAKEKYIEILTTNPLNVTALNNLGYVHIMLKEYPMAIDVLKRSAEIKENIDTHYNLGFAYMENNDNYAARLEMEKVIKVNPDYAEAYYNLATIYARKQDKEKTLQMLKTALEKGLKNKTRITNDQDFILIHDTELYKSLTEE